LAARRPVCKESCTQGRRAAKLKADYAPVVRNDWYTTVPVEM